MAFRKPNSLSQFLDRYELTGLHAPPPSPRAANGAQDMRVLGLILAWAVVGGGRIFGRLFFLRTFRGIGMRTVSSGIVIPPPRTSARCAFSAEAVLWLQRRTLTACS